MKTVNPITGEIIDANKVEFIDRLIQMKNKRDKWDVIREIVEYWKKTRADEYESFLVDIDEKRRTRGDKYGSTKGSRMRYMADAPKPIIVIAKTLYKDIKLDKQFFTEFAKKFPEFRVCEKL